MNKSLGRRGQPVDVRDAFVVQHQDTGPISVRCEMVGMSRRGVYADRQGQVMRDIDLAEVTLVARVQARAAQTGHREGRRRSAKPLQAEGDAVGRWKARRLMSKAGLAGRRRKRGRVMSRSPIRCGGDITSVWTAAGWEYLAVLLDLSSRKVVGWAMQSRMAAAWVQAAWRMALGRRRPAAGLLQHAARGSP